jgi:hypothetical protein
MMKLNVARATALGAVLLAISVASRGDADPYYLVTADLPGRGEAGIFRLQDRNGDGDALDIGENVLWARGMTSAADIRRFGSTGIMAADPGLGQLVLLQDRNGDGDALDIGEGIVWADGLGSVFGFDVRGDRVLAADLSSDRIFQLADMNGDGDALDIGERLPFAEDINDAISVRSHGDDVMSLSFSDGSVHQLRDINGDGDALDIGENVLYTPLGGLNDPAGLLTAGDTLLVSERGGNRISTATDMNGDGDALDIVELLSYAGAGFGHLDGPWNMTHYDRDGLLVVENFGGQVSLLRDINGDGDALDIGEVILWANDLDFPIGILLVPEPVGWLPFAILTVIGMLIRPSRDGIAGGSVTPFGRPDRGRSGRRWRWQRHSGPTRLRSVEDQFR